MAIAAKFFLSFLIFFVISWVVFVCSHGGLQEECAVMVGRFCAVGAIISAMYWIWS